MTDLNSVTIGGRITNISEKDFGYLTTGTAKLTIHIANNKSVKKNNEWVDQTSFFDVEIWGKFAEAMQQKIYKGLEVVVVGTIKQDRWQDAQSGQNRSRVIITADNIRTYPKEQASAPQYQQPAQNQQQDYQQGGFQEDYPADWQ